MNNLLTLQHIRQYLSSLGEEDEVGTSCSLYSSYECLGACALVYAFGEQGAWVNAINTGWSNRWDGPSRYPIDDEVTILLDAFDNLHDVGEMVYKRELRDNPIFSVVLGE